MSKLEGRFLKVFVFGQQKQLAEERVQALLSDRKVRNQEEELHRANLNIQIEQLTQRLKQSQESVRLSTKDFIIGIVFPSIFLKGQVLLIC